jgi:ATP synthase protein I
MTTAQPTSGPGTRPRLVQGEVRAAFLLTLVLGIVLLGVAALTTGPPGIAGAAIGGGMVLVFFGFGAVAVNAVASVAPNASLLVALLTYTLEVLALGVVFTVLTRSGALDDEVHAGWLAGTLIAGTAVWLVAQVVAVTRSRQPLYDLPERPGEEPSEGSEASA